VTTTRIETGSAGTTGPPQDETTLSEEARKRERKLFAQVDAANAELAALEAERALRAPGSDFTDLNDRRIAATEQWDTAMYTIGLVLGHTREEAIANTHAGFAHRLREAASSQETTQGSGPQDGAVVIRLRARDAATAPIPSSRFVGRQAPSYIRVAELAQGLGQPIGAVRRLLDLDLIPGARRKTPGTPNSPWLIPANAVGAYLAIFETEGAT
jgi:hypothetical protein